MIYEDLMTKYATEIEMVKKAFDVQKTIPNYYEVIDAYIMVFGGLFNFCFDDLFNSSDMEEEHFKYVKEIAKELAEDIIRKQFSISAIRKKFNKKRLQNLYDYFEDTICMNSLQKSLLLMTFLFNQIVIESFGYYSFIYYCLRNPSKSPNIRKKIMNAQKLICDLYLNSELYCFPFMSYSEMFFFSLRKSSKVSANNFLNLLETYIPITLVNNGDKALKIIKAVDVENGIHIKFLSKEQGINKGMRIIVETNRSNIEWFYKSYHLASIAKKDKQTQHNSSDVVNLLSISTPFSNSNTTVPIFGVSQSFLNFREPLIYVILNALDFAPFTFFHINLYTIGGFFIVSKGLCDYVLWSSFVKSNGIQKLNSIQLSCLSMRIIEISILSASLGLYDLHSNNIMIKIDKNDVNLKIIDFAYCNEHQYVPSNMALINNLNEIIDIIKRDSIDDLICFNESHSFLRFLIHQDYYKIFADMKLHCYEGSLSLIQRINGIINKSSIIFYSEGIIQNNPLHKLLSGESNLSTEVFPNYKDFIIHQVDAIKQTMETTIPIDGFPSESSLKERRICDYIGFTNLESIQKIAPYFFCKEDSEVIRESTNVSTLLEKLNIAVSPGCLFKARHIDRIYDYSINELEIYSQHIVSCFSKIFSHLLSKNY